MTDKLAIIDIDGVIADRSEVFTLAAEAKGHGLADGMSERDATDLYWHTVFDPGHAHLDTLIPGADAAIHLIGQAYQVIYLTSRPELMRVATQGWLTEHRLAGPLVVHKPSAFQYTKTVTWKAGMVQTLANLYLMDEILFVDDEEMNRNELTKFAATFRSLIIVDSLQTAARFITTGKLPDPFEPKE